MAAGQHASEVDNAIKQLLANPGVTQYVIANTDGIPIKHHNMDWKKAVQYCALVSDLVNKSHTAVGLLMEASENKVEYLRLHTAKNKEIIIAPEKDYTLIAVQEPQPKGTQASSEKKEE